MFWKQCRVWHMPGSLPQGLFGRLCYHVLKYNRSISFEWLPVGAIGTNPFLLHIVVTLQGEIKPSEPSRLLFSSTDRRQMGQNGPVETVATAAADPDFERLVLLRKAICLRRNVSNSDRQENHRLGSVRHVTRRNMFFGESNVTRGRSARVVFFRILFAQT